MDPIQTKKPRTFLAPKTCKECPRSFSEEDQPQITLCTLTDQYFLFGDQSIPLDCPLARMDRKYWVDASLETPPDPAEIVEYYQVILKDQEGILRSTFLGYLGNGSWRFNEPVLYWHRKEGDHYDPNEF